MSEPTNGYAVITWTWRERLQRWFLPTRWCPPPAAPAHFEDVLFVNVLCVLDWADRLRLLFTGRLQVDTRVVCEFKPGDTVSCSVAYPVPAGGARPPQD